MKRKTITSVILSVMLLAAGLTGCGKGNETPEQTKQQDGQRQSTAGTGQQSSPGEGTTLKLFGFTPGYEAVLPAISDDYFAETGVRVEIETGGEDYYTVLKARFASGQAPDIFDMDTASFAAWEERCADLSDCEFTGHAFESSLQSGSLNGRVIGFPYAFEASGFIYNKQYFREAGVEVPTTLTELKEVCRKLQEAGYQPFGEAWGEWGFLMHIFGTPFAYEGDCLALAEKLNNKEMTLADMKYMDNFFELYDLTLDYGFGVESIGYSVTTQVPDFAAGKMAMIKQGTWLNDMIFAANPNMEMGLMAVPLTDDPTQTKLMISTSRYLSVNQESANYEEACRFLDWLYANIQKYIVDPIGVLAPYDNIDTSGLTGLNADMFAYAQEDMAYSSFGTDYWPTGFNVDVATPLQAYAAGNMSKEDAMKELQSLYDSRIETSR